MKDESVPPREDSASDKHGKAAKVGANSSEDAAYLKMRLENMTPEEKESMEEVLKAHSGLTPEEYMEMTIAYGF